MESLRFLKPNVVIEPLFNRWYAWSHLVSPATAAMNITGRHLKIMNSYVQSPNIHAAAVKNPQMLGGPFMDYPSPKVREIEELRMQTIKRCEDPIAFAKAVIDLDNMLKNWSKGFSLEPVYEKVPGILKGYVELVYDLNNNPSFRFFETLLYRSNFYSEKSQSIALWVTNNDERPFVLSTPKLNDPNVIHLDIPFNSPVIDNLARMKRTAGNIEAIRTAMQIPSALTSLFESFFTAEAPPRYEKYQGDKIRMRYFGHACILIETLDVSILVDPLISYYGYFSKIEHYSDVDLPDKIDYVLITHNHQDHVLLETLLPLRHKIRNIVVPKGGNGSLQDPSLKLMLQEIGFENVLELGELETIRFRDCHITGIPFMGEHCDLNIPTKICHHVNFFQFSVLLAADSCNVEPRLYDHVQKIIGNIDIIFLGMECLGAPLTWLYGPLLSQELPRDKDSSRRLSGSNYERGRSLINAFNPKEVYVYAMGLEPWLEFISSIRYSPDSYPMAQSGKLIEELNSRGITAERLFGEKELLYEKVMTLS
jgi:L-ascorbate metabolism protein UlaG (beta-lactamase superfamily)